MDGTRLGRRPTPRPTNGHEKGSESRLHLIKWGGVVCLKSSSHDGVFQRCVVLVPKLAKTTQARMAVPQCGASELLKCTVCNFELDMLSGRFVESQLFGVKAADPPVFAIS